MPKIRISDKFDSRPWLSPEGSEALSFDLIDLLEILGGDAVKSQWVCKVDDYITKEDIPDFWEDFGDPLEISGAKLMELAKNTRQIIDGSFAAFYPNEALPWITINAIDSSYWEISSENVNIIKRFEKHFSKVEYLPNQH